MKTLIASMVLSTMLFSCSSTPKPIQKLSPNVEYKRDMLIKVNGQTGIGILVVKKADVFNFHIEASGQLDLFTFKTCHREWDKQSAWNVSQMKKRLFWKHKIDKKKELTFEIKLTDVEKSRYCPSVLTGYERKGGRHSWGFVDYQSDNEQLIAEVHCNGEQYSSNGVTICQSKVGTIQRINFKNKVVVIPAENCSKMTTKDNKLFSYFMPKGSACVYPFVENGTGKVHRLTAIGYESILIREKND